MQVICELMGYTIERKTTRVQDKHATIIICPGGGYHLFQIEADPVALKLITMGYNAFVLNYLPS